MTQTVTVDKHIRRPAEEVGAFVADPHRFIPVLATVGRCEYVGDRGDDQLWDVFLVSGTIHVGGRVLVSHRGNGQLGWRSLSGTRHSFQALVEGNGQDSCLTIALTYSLAGFGVARLSELIGRGIVGRNLEAAAEEIRHRLEFDEH
ncbi:MAG TPA: hypothetical protein VMS16_05570 [Mycobacterium sp.]|jgi:hypothetical protein|nr:hypothetical protein [Mycobacterium sp.]